MTLLTLYLLALLDGLLCGLRTSMGRCPLIRKHSYYTRALFRGIAGAQVVSMLALAALLLTGGFSLRRVALRADLESAAGRMLWVFLPYACLVLFNLALRLGPFNRYTQRYQRPYARASYRHPASGHHRRRPVWNIGEQSA